MYQTMKEMIYWGFCNREKFINEECLRGKKKRRLCGVLWRPVNKEVICESLGSHSEGYSLVLSGLWERRGVCCC